RILIRTCAGDEKSIYLSAHSNGNQFWFAIASESIHQRSSKTRSDRLGDNHRIIAVRPCTIKTLQTHHHPVTAFSSSCKHRIELPGISSVNAVLKRAGSSSINTYHCILAIAIGQRRDSHTRN